MQSQNRDLWFTLPPQRSLLVSWLFSAIPIPILKFSFFYYTSYYYEALTHIVNCIVRYCNNIIFYPNESLCIRGINWDYMVVKPMQCW